MGLGSLRPVLPKPVDIVCPICSPDRCPTVGKEVGMGVYIYQQWLVRELRRIGGKENAARVG